MPFKPMKRRDYERWIKLFNWSLEKGSIDSNLYDQEGQWVCTIKMTHPGGEVPAPYVEKTRKKLKERGFNP